MCLSFVSCPKVKTSPLLEEILCRKPMCSGKQLTEGRQSLNAACGEFMFREQVEKQFFEPGEKHAALGRKAQIASRSVCCAPGEVVCEEGGFSS